jgi:hypothetical protein
MHARKISTINPATTSRFILFVPERLVRAQPDKRHSPDQTGLTHSISPETSCFSLGKINIFPVADFRIQEILFCTRRAEIVVNRKLFRLTCFPRSPELKLCEYIITF